MSVYKIVFSPAGGTDKAADAVCRGIEKDFKTIDLSVPDKDFGEYKLKSDDFAVIAVPSFGGRVPETAARRLAEIKADGTHAALVCVYGNREFDDTLVELYDIAENCGFQNIAAVTAIARHSIAPVYAHGRPDGGDEAVLKNFSQKIAEKLQNEKGADLKIKSVLPGSRPYKKYSEIKAAPKAKKGCGECGICADMCPVGAIDKNNIKSADKEKCVSCMRCVWVCPQKARSLNPLMVKTVTLALKKACREPKENKLYL